MSELTDWSDAIAKHGEESRQRNEAALQKAKAELPMKIVELINSNDEVLVGHTILYSQRGFADPRMTAIILELADAGKAEILQRLKNRKAG